MAMEKDANMEDAIITDETILKEAKLEPLNPRNNLLKFRICWYQQI